MCLKLVCFDILQYTNVKELNVNTLSETGLNSNWELLMCQVGMCGGQTPRKGLKV